MKKLIVLVVLLSMTAFAKGARTDEFADFKAEEAKVEKACGCAMSIQPGGPYYTTAAERPARLNGTKAVAQGLIKACAKPELRVAVCDQIGQVRLKPTSEDPTAVVNNRMLYCTTKGTLACPVSDVVSAIESTAAATPAPVANTSALEAPKAGACTNRITTAVKTGFITTDAQAIDMNGDGKTDIIAVDGAPGGRSGIRVYLSKGKGVFAPPVFTTIKASMTFGANAFNDANGDGVADVLLRNDNGPIELYLGSKDGHFKLKDVVAREGSSPRIEDVTGDHKMDLLSEDPFSAGDGLLMSKGLGGGKFAPGKRIGGAAAAEPAASDYLSWAIAEMTGDALPDLVTLHMRGDGPYGPCILKNKGGTFPDEGACVDSTLYDGSSGEPNHLNGLLVVADFNGDKKPDVAVGPSAGSFVIAREISIHLNTGRGTFGPAKLIGLHQGTGQSFRTLQTADVSGDGKSDLIGVFKQDKHTLHVAVSHGDGTFSAPYDAIELPIDGNDIFFGFGDFDGDGRQSMFTFTYDGLNIVELKCAP